MLRRTAREGHSRLSDDGMSMEMTECCNACNFPSGLPNYSRWPAASPGGGLEVQSTRAPAVPAQPAGRRRSWGVRQPTRVLDGYLNAPGTQSPPSRTRALGSSQRAQSRPILTSWLLLKIESWDKALTSFFHLARPVYCFVFPLSTTSCPGFNRIPLERTTDRTTTTPIAIVDCHARTLTNPGPSVATCSDQRQAQ